MPFSLLNLVRVAATGLIFLIPGLLIERLLLADIQRGRAIRATVAGASGLGAFGLFLWAGNAIEVSLTARLIVWALVCAAAAAILLFRRNRAAIAAAGVPSADLPDFTGATGRWLLGLCLIGALTAIPFGTYFSSAADVWEYLNRASAILRVDRLNAPNPYSPDLHSPYDPTFYGIIASLSRISGVPPAELWHLFPALATPIEIGVVAAAAGIITGSGPAGLIAAIIYTVFYGPFFLFRNSVHHQMLADTLYLLALASLFLYVRVGRRRHLILGGLAAAAGTTLHHFLVVQSAFGIGIAGAAILIARRRSASGWRRPLAYVAAVALFLLPAVVVLLTTHLENVDPKSMDSFFREYAPLLHFGPLYIPDPFTWYFRTFWHPIPALLLVFYFGRRLFKDERALVLGLLVWMPVLLVMNPLVFPLLAEAIGLQVATRLLNLTAYPSVILMGWILSEKLSRTRTLLLVGVSLLCVLPQTLIRAQGDYWPPSVAREWADSPVRWRKGIERLGRETEPGVIVISDPVTSFSVPTFAPLYIVATTRADFAFQAPDFARRRLACDTVMDPLGSPDSTYAALREYNVRHIVMNRLFANPLLADKLEMMAKAAPGLKRRFDAEHLLVYDVEPDQFPEDPPPAEAFRTRLLIDPATFASFLEPGTGITFDRETGIGGVMGPEEVAPGDTLYITFYYEARSPAPPGNWYAKLLRDDAYGSKWLWLRRQIVGSIFGRPESMLFPRDLHFEAFHRRKIPDGHVFADQFLIAVPGVIVPGRYSLRVAPGTFATEGAMGLPLGTVDIRKNPRPPGPATP